MSPTAIPPHDAQLIGLLAMIVAALCVTYWRAALRLVAIVVIGLTIFGVVLLLETLDHH